MAAPIKFLSGRTQQQKIGIEGSTENQKVLEVVGRVGIGTTIFESSVELEVRGDQIITGILTVGNTTIGGGGGGGDLNVQHVETTTLNVSGVSTFAGNINANGNIVGDTATNISGINSVTATSFFGDGSGLENTGATLSAASGSQRLVLTNLTSGTMTSAATDADLSFNAASNLLSAGKLLVSGISTFTGDIDANGGLDVDGHTELDDVNVSGAITATTFTGNLAGTVNTAAQTNITSLGTLTGLDVNGHSELNNVNVSGIITASSLNVTDKLTTTGIGISIANGGGNVAYIEGPSEIWIDPSPAGAGTTSGSVRIRGDLYVDGTEFIVDVDKIELGDFNIGIASTVSTNSLLDGAGLGIGATGIRKTITWNNSTSALMSSENWNLASGKHYEIAGTDVLTSDTLGSGVVNSSLTSVGTLGSLTVSGDVSANGNIVGDNATNISGINSVTATSFYGSGTNLTALNASNLGSGTVPDARFPVTLPTISGVNLTALNASNLGSGTVPDARFPATLPVIDGSNLTGITANQVGAISGVSIREEGSVVGTANSVGDINFVSSNLTATASGVGATITLTDTPTFTSTVIGTGVTVNSSGINLTGVVTATSFTGSGANLTGITASQIGALRGITIKEEGSIIGTASSVSSINFVSSNLTATASGIGASITLTDTPTFSSLNVTGTTTIPNISGVTTFANTVNVGTGITLDSTSGIISATAFYGDGQNLSNLINQRIEGLQIFDEGVAVGTGFTFAALDVVGNNVSVSAVGLGTTARITISDTPTFDTVTVTNNITANGNIVGDNSTNISGINSVTATSFSGDGSQLTGLNAGLDGVTIREEGSIVGTANSIADINFVSSNLTATASGVGATITLTDSPSFTGTVTAASFSGDGSDLFNVNGFSTSLSSDQSSPLYKIYKETKTLNVTAGIHTVSSDPDHDNLAFTKSSLIVVSAGGTFEVSSGTTFRTNIIDLFPAGAVSGTTVSGITTGGISSIVEDTTPQLGGNLDLNSKFITGTGGVNVTGVVTTTKLHVGVDTGFYNEDLVVTGDARITGILTIGTASITINPITKTLTGLEELQIGSGTTEITIKKNEDGNIVFADILGKESSVGIGTTVSINTTGIITATTFSGSGVNLTSLTGASAGTYGASSATPIITVDSNGRITGISTVAADGGISSIVEDTTPQLGGNLDLNSKNITGTGNINLTGDITATSANFSGNVSIAGTLTYDDVTNIDSIGIITARSGINVTSGGINVSSGIITATSLDAAISEWVLGANGSSDYTFTGPGLTGAENDPSIYIVRGQKYNFKNGMGAHPFRIQSTPNGSTGTQYNDGITNNDVSNGTLVWDVQFDAPEVLYYQCTSHAAMGGKIYIGNSGESIVVGAAVTINSSGINATGIVTATTFVGALTGTASNASGATSDFSIADKIIHTGDTNTAIRFPAADTFTVETAGSERLRIDSNGSITLSGLTKEPAYVTTTAISSDYTFDLANGNVQFRNSGAPGGTGSSFKPYLTFGGSNVNTFMAVNDILTFTIICTGAAGSYFTGLAIDSSVQTVNWAGGSAPTDGSAKDMYVFTIVKTASNTYTVIGNQTKTA